MEGFFFSNGYWIVPYKVVKFHFLTIFMESILLFRNCRVMRDLSRLDSAVGWYCQLVQRQPR